MCLVYFLFFLEKEEKLSCEAKILRRVFNIYIYLFKLEAWSGLFSLPMCIRSLQRKWEREKWTSLSHVMLWLQLSTAQLF